MNDDLPVEGRETDRNLVNDRNQDIGPQADESNDEDDSSIMFCCKLCDQEFEENDKVCAKRASRFNIHGEVIHWECLKIALKPMNMTELEISENCEVRYITRLDKNELGITALQFSEPIYQINQTKPRCTTEVKCGIVVTFCSVSVIVLLITLIITLSKDHCGP